MNVREKMIRLSMVVELDEKLGGIPKGVFMKGSAVGEEGWLSRLSY